MYVKVWLYAEIRSIYASKLGKYNWIRFYYKDKAGEQVDKGTEGAFEEQSWKKIKLKKGMILDEDKWSE